MTTAHRATWKAAHGGAGEEGSFSLHAPSTAVAARDVAGQTALKVRARGPARSSSELRHELDERERALKRARTVAAAMIPLRSPADHASAILASNAAFQNLDADVDLGVGSGDEGEGAKKRKLAAGGRNGSQRENEQRGLDAAGSASEDLKEDSRGTTTVVDETTAAYDEGAGLGSRNIDDLPVKNIDEGIDEKNDIEDDEDNEDDDEDDDEEELRAELMRIRAEREEERVASEVEQAAAGNPLLKLSKYPADSVDETDGESIRSEAPAEFRVRRRWDDDVVFKNQAKNERPVQPRFINDTIRNDFHRRFMKRYVR